MPPSRCLAEQITHDLRETNKRLRDNLDRLSPALSAGTAQQRSASPDEISALLSELMRAGEWLRALPEETDAELEHELSMYRKQVERLRDLLPSIHRTLLRERARLEQERERVTLASEWARGSQQIL